MTATTHETGDGAITPVSAFHFNVADTVQHLTAEDFAYQWTYLVPFRVERATEVQILYRAIQITEEAPAACLCIQVNGQCLVVAVKDALVVVAASTYDCEVRTRQIYIIQQLSIGGVVALIYQIGKPNELVSSLYLIEAVHQRSHTGIHLTADDTDTILVLMVGNILCLSIRIGKRCSVGTLSRTIQITCCIYLQAVRERNRCIISTQSLPPSDFLLVAVHHVAKLTRCYLLLCYLSATFVIGYPFINIIAVAYSNYARTTCNGVADVFVRIFCISIYGSCEYAVGNGGIATIACPTNDTGHIACLGCINSALIDTIVDFYARSTGTCTDTGIAGIQACCADDVNRRDTVLDGSAETLTHNAANFVDASCDGAVNLQVLDSTRHASKETPTCSTGSAVESNGVELSVERTGILMVTGITDFRKLGIVNIGFQHRIKCGITGIDSQCKVG